jgi:hypothetical protein
MWPVEMHDTGESGPARARRAFDQHRAGEAGGEAGLALEQRARRAEQPEDVLSRSGLAQGHQPFRQDHRGGLVGGEWEQAAEDELAPAILSEGEELDVHPGRPRQEPTYPTGPSFEGVGGRRQQVGDVLLAWGVHGRRLVLAAEQATGAVGGQPRGLFKGPIDEENTASAVEEENSILSALE